MEGLRGFAVFLVFVTHCPHLPAFTAVFVLYLALSYLHPEKSKYQKAAFPP
jgi:hypothetical protein